MRVPFKPPKENPEAKHRTASHALGLGGGDFSELLPFTSHLGMGQNSPSPSVHPTRLKWVVYLPQKGTIGFKPQPLGYGSKFNDQEIRF